MACYSANVVKLIKRLQLCLLVLAAVVVPTTAASAESNLAAIICDSSQPAVLTVVQPESDSVVTNAQIEVSGTVAQASQLELYVDDAYSGVVPLSYNDTSFSTTVSVSLGTHTIKVVAVDVCQVGNATASVVVTYQNAPSASTGSKVPTNVDGTTVTGQEVSSNRNPLEQFIILPLFGVAQSLDLIAYDSTDGHINNANVIRFVVIVAALLMMFYAGPISRWLLRQVKRIGWTVKVTAAQRRKMKRIIVGIGLGIIIIVFMI
ncbi:MAG TPA: hypothetical protein VF281_04545 [Candidatus Saccharimonadales bacterium]